MADELADWPNEEAQFVTQRCPTLEEARKVAYQALAPGAHWRAAVIWRVGDTVHVQTQDAERDQVAVMFTYPIRRRSLRRRGRRPGRGVHRSSPLERGAA